MSLRTLIAKEMPSPIVLNECFGASGGIKSAHMASSFSLAEGESGKQQKESERVTTLEEKCVYHWLNCLYADFLMERKAGEQFPCSSCQENKNCKSCPPFNFNLAGEKLGLKVEYRRSKVR